MPSYGLGSVSTRSPMVTPTSRPPDAASMAPPPMNTSTYDPAATNTEQVPGGFGPMNYTYTYRPMDDVFPQLPAPITWGAFAVLMLTVLGLGYFAGKASKHKGAGSVWG